MANVELQEQVLSAWIYLNGILKNSRLTSKMTYNEAVIMKLAFEQYRRDGVGLIPVQRIIKETHMLKSLVNRTVNKLCERGYLRRRRNPDDGRNLLVAPVRERLPDFLAVHEQSLQMVQHVIDIIGEEDAAHFVRTCGKLSQSELYPPAKGSSGIRTGSR